MSRTLLIADLALGCERTAQRRRFDSARQMDRLLIERWEQTVAPNDLVYLLGDTWISAYSRNSLMRRLARLPGFKFVLQGDRDPDNVGPDVVEIIFIKDGRERPIVLCHYPFERWRRDYQHSAHVHGHVLSATTIDGRIKNRFNVCAEAVGYAPIEIGKLLSQADERAFIAIKAG